MNRQTDNQGRGKGGGKGGCPAKPDKQISQIKVKGQHWEINYNDVGRTRISPPPRRLEIRVFQTAK